MKNHWLQCLSILIGITFFTSAFSEIEDNYICTTDKVSGYDYSDNSKTWEYARFTAEDKFVIKKVKPTSYNNFSGYEVTKMGNKVATYRCNVNLNDDPIISCKSRVLFFPNVFYYSKVTGYFQEYIHGTLVTGQNDTPYIAIGKCSPFQ